MKTWEKGVGLAGGIGSFFKDANASNISQGVIATIFGLSAGMLHISAGRQAGLSEEIIINWVVAFYLINGFFGVIVPMYYRLPVPMANSIPGIVIFATSIATIGLAPTLGAFAVAGVLCLIVGATGMIGKIMKLIPTPILLGMMAGILLRFGLGMVSSLGTALVPAAIMILAYILTQKFIPKFPAVCSSLLVGIATIFTLGIDLSTVKTTVNFPQFIMPEFTLATIISVGLPFALLLIAVETPVGVAALKAGGYEDKKIPYNGLTIINGATTAISPFFYLHSTCVAGPMTAITASHEAGPKERRWVGATLIGLIWIVSAPFYGMIVNFFMAAPAYFVNTIAGLALLGVLSSTISGSVGAEKHKVGALFAFLVGASNVVIGGIGAAFWALCIGVIVSLLFETKDFEFNTFKKSDNMPTVTTAK